MKGGMLRRSWKLTSVKRKGNNLEITLYADPLIAPYAPYVEEGHRTVSFTSHKTVGWWEGHHMARISVAEVQRQIPAAYRQSFMRWLKTLR